MDKAEMESIDKEMKDLGITDFEGESDSLINDVKELSKSKKKDENTIYTSFLETPEFFLEEVADSTHSPLSPFGALVENVYFIKYSKKDDNFERIKEFNYKDKIYRPITGETDDTIKKGGIALPSGPLEYKNTKEIIDDIKQFLNERVQFPTDPVNYQEFLPHLILFYWVFEKFPFIPYTHFVGGTSSGKTTAMEHFGSLCYKPIDCSSSLTISSMFHIATKWQGTLLIDEFDSIGDNRHDIIAFLKAGVSNRLLYRMEGEKTKKITAYLVKSPKLFTSENPITDAGLQSRTIVIHMEKSNKELPLFKLQEDYDQADKIRNKLLLWRLRNFNNIDLSKIKYGFPEFKKLDRRVQQIITPIYYFSDSETKDDIIKFATDQNNETLRARRESLPGQIFEIIEENAVFGVSISTIMNAINKNLKYPVTERKIAGLVRKSLGFETQRTGTGSEKETIVILEGMEDKIERLRTEYGIISTSPNGESGESVQT